MAQKSSLITAKWIKKGSTLKWNVGLNWARSRMASRVKVTRIELEIPAV